MLPDATDVGFFQYEKHSGCLSPRSLRLAQSGATGGWQESLSRL